MCCRVCLDAVALLCVDVFCVAVRFVLCFASVSCGCVLMCVVVCCYVLLRVVGYCVVLLRFVVRCRVMLCDGLSCCVLLRVVEC